MTRKKLFFHFYPNYNYNRNAVLTFSTALLLLSLNTATLLCFFLQNIWLPCCLSTGYLFKCMHNAFPPLITIGNTFPFVITVENTFPLFVTVGKNNASSFFLKNVAHLKCHLWATVSNKQITKYLNSQPEYLLLTFRGSSTLISLKSRQNKRHFTRIKIYIRYIFNCLF